LCYILKKVKILISTSKNIHFNLALEQYLLENNVEDVLLWYINKPCVVIGKHQNPWKEVNFEKTKNTINVARRMSGGGTVYHDEGNLNFSFIRNKTADFVNFKEHIIPISNALHSLGIVNVISPRNDIFISDHKISGNAEHVSVKYKKIIHHGTLLYDADIENLAKNIKPTKIIPIETHAVNSVRSPVLNIRKVLDLGMVDVFFEKMVSLVKNEIGEGAISFLNPEEIQEVQTLVQEKYTHWDWIFGQTPQFKYSPNMSMQLTVRKGKITVAVKDGQDFPFWNNLSICNVNQHKPENLSDTEWSEYLKICLPY
jgi:lipoate---protein ligase